jgi:hypothetical protein
MSTELVFDFTTVFPSAQGLFRRAFCCEIITFFAGFLWFFLQNFADSSFDIAFRR